MSARAPEPDRVCPQSRDALLFAVAPARLVAVACCGALCIWPAHANAEEAPAEPPAATEPASVPVPPAAASADIPPSSYWTTERIAGWSLLGAAAASTGLAIYFESERREAREANEELLTGAPSPDAGDESVRLEEEYQQALTGTVVASITAVVSGVFGAFFLLNSYDSAAPPSTTAQVSVDPTGARIDFSGRF